MPRFTILLGKILGGTTVAMFHGSLVLALAGFADISLAAADLGRGVAYMFLLAFGLTSLGVVIANRIRSFEGFGVFSNAVILPLYFTSSSIFPLDPSLTAAQTKVVYPEWLAMMVQWNPFTYAVDALRGPSSISTSSTRNSARSCWSAWRCYFSLSPGAISARCEGHYI